MTGEPLDLEPLEVIAEWLGSKGATPIDVACNLFGPKCIRFAGSFPEPAALVWDGGWYIILRRASPLCMRYALARALARWALFQKRGRATPQREAEVNYVGLALFAPRKPFVADARQLALKEVAAKYGLDETAALVRMSELLPQPVAIVYDDDAVTSDNWPGVEPVAPNVRIRGPWTRSRDAEELKSWAKDPPKGIRAIRLSDYPRTALVETG